MIADSSFLVSLFDNEDVNHSKARAEFEKMEGWAVVCSCTLEEVFTCLAYKYGAKRALECVDEMLGNESFVAYFFERDEWEEVWDLCRKSGRKISFVDYANAYLALGRNEGLLCYDRQLKSLVKKMKREKDG